MPKILPKSIKCIYDIHLVFHLNRSYLFICITATFYMEQLKMSTTFNQLFTNNLLFWHFAVKYMKQTTQLSILFNWKWDSPIWPPLASCWLQHFVGASIRLRYPGIYINAWNELMNKRTTVKYARHWARHSTRDSTRHSTRHSKTVRAHFNRSKVYKQI